VAPTFVCAPYDMKNSQACIMKSETFDGVRKRETCKKSTFKNICICTCTYTRTHKTKL